MILVERLIDMKLENCQASLTSVKTLTFKLNTQFACKYHLCLVNSFQRSAFLFIRYYKYFF